MFWKKTDSLVQCGLCSHRCKIADNGKGFCGVRKNEKNVLYSLVYGKACSVAIDPIEKKPLFHFAPGSQTLSISTVGCNFRCDFCQNFEISQPDEIFGEELPPEKILSMFKSSKASGISWTYTEPTVFYEYFYDTAKALSLLVKEKAPGEKRKQYYNIWVSNGYTTTEALEKAGKLINAVNVDYKGDEAFYRKHCLTELEHVQEALCEYKRLGIWLEITNLLIPGHNDKDEQIKEMVQWILDNLGQVPLHFSRFFPHHKLRADITTTEALERAAKIASDIGINYVYIGNLRHEKENTYCHNCKELLIERIGFNVTKLNLEKKGRQYHCPNCNTKTPVAGMQWASLIKK